MITWKVVVNDAEQYSIWPADKHVATGWRDTGIAGSREHCLSYVESVWLDLSPLDLRQHDAGPYDE